MEDSTNDFNLNRRPAVRCGRYGLLVALTTASLVLALLAGGLAIWAVVTKQTEVKTVFDGNGMQFSETSIGKVVEKVSPSVVSVLTTTKTETYFGTYDSSAAGTGVIVSANGYILTNKHVIKNASNVRVVVSDGTEFENVKVVATDPLNDLAFLKIQDIDDLKFAEIGDSKTISLGQPVVAVGNALGQYQNSITSGIISGVNRSLEASTDGSESELLTDMIQTDAAINSGNSGGPLVNAAGQVIGINTAMANNAQSIGFAIPINAVKGMLNGLLKTGKAERAYLGVNYVPITPEVAKSYKLSVKTGAYLYSQSGASVVKNSPADKAGLKDKDIVLEVGDAKVGVQGSVSNLVSEYSPGDTVDLKILRGDDEKTVKVTLGAYKG
jgi:serine protease Do